VYGVCVRLLEEAMGKRAVVNTELSPENGFKVDNDEE
jgi:hypothetical protein